MTWCAMLQGIPLLPWYACLSYRVPVVPIDSVAKKLRQEFTAHKNGDMESKYVS